MSIVVTGSIAYDYLMSFPGQVHRAPPARARAAREPELPGRQHGQASGRLRAEHRLHAGAAGRAAAADGDGGPGLRRLSPLAGTGRRRHLARQGGAGKFTASFFCSTDTENNQIASFYTGAMANAGELSFRTAGRGEAGDHLAQRSGRDAAVRRGVPDAGDPVHLRSGPAVRAHVGPELAEGLAARGW